MQPGERIDHYRLVSLVGAGGMGEVYRAVDERLRRDVAIKVLPHSTGPAEREARLLREAQAASHLNHPGIVTIHDVGRWLDRTYIVMELVDGRRLSELAGIDIGAAAAVALCRQAAEAMAVAHERGILHRDIKPDNLMVTRDDRVKILDFGVAKVYDPNASLEPEPLEPQAAPTPVLPSPEATSGASDVTLVAPPHTPSTISVTRTGALLGTPAYMSPEQAAGAAVDERSEVYSLGLVLYELLTGVRPIQRATLPDTLAAAREPAIPPASTAARGRAVPRACDRLLGRALARAPADRHPTMRALADDLRRLEQDLTRRRGWSPRHWLALALAVVLLAGGAAVAVLWFEGERVRPAAAPAIEVESVRRLTFDPGCEELPAFWPDGASVVFDGIVDGDTEILRVDVATGARQRLTRNPGWDMAASVSPDGRFIAFIRFTERGRELMVMPWSERGAGEARSLGTSRSYPSWTRSGRVLAGDDRYGVQLLDPEGRRPAEVVASLPGYFAVEFEEVAGGDLLVGYRHSAQDPGRLGLGRVRGGRFERMGGIPPLDASGIARDAGGGGFYFGEMTDSGPRLYWRSLAGDQRRSLDDVPFPHGGMAADRGGRRLALSTCRQLFQIGRIEGGRFTPLFTGRDWSDAHISAVGDGTYVFASDRSGASGIWIGRPGEAPRPLIAEPSAFPAVARDGRRMAWVAITPERRGIHLSGIDGSSARALTRNDTDDQPAFSADGTEVYFLRSTPEGTRVFRIGTSGGEAVPVTAGGVAAFAPSPVDGRMAWLVQEASGRRLAIGDPAGQYALVPTMTPANYTEVAFSADGTTLWVARGSNEILELPADGGGEPSVIWRTTNDLVGFMSADAGGLLADVATYDGDIYLVEGRFR